MGKPLNEVQLPNWVGRVSLIFVVIAGWTTLAMVYRFVNLSGFISCSIMIGPSTLFLTWFAFGGDVPRKLRIKNWPRLTWVIAVFSISVLAFFIVVLFLPPAGPATP